jgi:hypothetical protein
MRFTFPKMPESVVSIKDTIIVEDPWGFGLRFEVLRADHEDCRAYDEANPESGFAALHARGALAQMMGGGAQMADDLAEKLTQRGVNLLQGDMERGKRKLALVVLRSWWGVMAEGVEIPFTPLVALEFLGFRGYAWRVKNDPTLVVKTAGEFEKLENTLHAREAKKLIGGGTSKVLEFAQQFTGEARDERGEVLVIPRTRTVQGKVEAAPHGGNPFGHALTMFLHSESMRAAASAAKAAEADTEAFQASPDTARESGEESGSSASDSSSAQPADSTPATAPPAQ